VILGIPISIRLDDDVREELEAQARARGIGLATLLRDVATRAARDARKSRIRQASAAIGDRVATTAEARALYDEVGTPTTDAG
jgi:hypothetical protein